MITEVLRPIDKPVTVLVSYPFLAPQTMTYAQVNDAGAAFAAQTEPFAAAVDGLAWASMPTDTVAQRSNSALHHELSESGVNVVSADDDVEVTGEQQPVRATFLLHGLVRDDIPEQVVIDTITGLTDLTVSVYY